MPVFFQGEMGISLRSGPRASVKISRRLGALAILSLESLLVWAILAPGASNRYLVAVGEPRYFFCAARGANFPAGRHHLPSWISREPNACSPVTRQSDSRTSKHSYSNASNRPHPAANSTEDTIANAAWNPGDPASRYVTSDCYSGTGKLRDGGGWFRVCLPAEKEISSAIARVA